MTEYYPYQNRKSLIEACILNAFKEAWRDEETLIKQEIKDGSAKTTTEHKKSYTSFNLSRSNQTFDIVESELFQKAVCLNDEMGKASPNSVSISKSSDSTLTGIRRSSFTSSVFETSQLNDRMSYFDAIKLIHSLYLSSPEMLYGVLLHDGTRFINPLHPIVAQSIIKNIEDEKKQGHSNSIDELKSRHYKVIIYTYQNRDNLISNHFHFDEKLEGVFLGQILSVLAMLETQSTIVKQATNYTAVDPYVARDAYNWKVFKYEYHIVNSSTNKQAENIFLQPVQVINNGIASPYYGIVAQKERANSSGTRGYQLSPMLSCNIGATFVRNQNDGKVIVDASSVCTGNYQNKSMDGKLSLNHANLGSPYFRDLIGHGSFTFADLCVKVSLGIYAEAFGLEKIDITTSKPQKPLSFEDYKRENKNATLKDYLLTIKGK